MLQSLVSAGPPLQDLASWNSSKPERSEESKGSFEKTLSERMKPTVDKPQKVRSLDDTEEVKDTKEGRAEAPTPIAPREKKAVLARQKAIEKFMDSFESEFGIPPTRLVEAMAQLPAEKLDMNPTETVDAVIAQLDLTEEEEDRAKEMYLGLISDLGRIDRSAASLSMATVDADAIMDSQIKQRFMAAQEKKALLNNSLEQMNQKFWMRSAEAPLMNSQMNSPMGAQAPLVDSEGFDRGLDFSTDEAVDPFQIPLPKEGLPTEKSPSQLSAQSLMEDLQQTENAAAATPMPSPGMKPLKDMSMKEMSTAEMANPTAQKELTEAGLPKGNFKFDPNVAPAKGDQVVMSQQGRNPQMNLQGEGFSGKETASSTPDPKVGGKSGGKSFSVDASKMVEGLPTPSLKGDVSSNAAPSVTPVATPAVTEANQDANVRQLMNQAQYLIKKGGGEMNVKMSPEGLGQVQMRVVVSEGKVNVHMATDSKEAKQLIESGLSDLKSQLSAQKLSVDHVKIDVVGNTSADTASQNSTQSQTQKDGGQKQFWQQFQQNFGNGGQRDALYEVPGMKGYNNQKRRDPLAVGDAEVASKARRAIEGKGSGLDLVA